MIKPIYKSYLDQAKAKFKPPTSAADIYRFYRAKAQELYEQSLKEAENAEDEDFITVDDKLKEECPICISEQEFRTYLENAVITRDIEDIWVHCTATQPEVAVSTLIRNWKRQGWINPGYPTVLPPIGFSIVADLDLVCNGVRGFNAKGIGISYTGGIDKNGKAYNTMTPSQRRLIEIFLEVMTKRFPKARVRGHNEVANKACPSFQLKNEFQNFHKPKLGIQE